MPITLFQINVDANNGSNGSIARDIGTIALSKGWKSYIAFGRRSIPCDSELIRIGNKADLFVHGLLTRFFDMHGLGSVFATKRLIRQMKRIKPDIVHLHNIHGYFLNYKLLFEYLNKEQIPVVWTFHDCWPFTGHCGHFTNVQCFRWLRECGDCPMKKRYPASLWLDRSRQNFQLKKRLFTTPAVDKLYITTVSEWLKSLVEQSFFAKYPIHVIFDGIDTESFIPRESNLRQQYGLQDKFVLISAAANWSKSKGWDDYIKLSTILPNDCVIMLLGVTPEQQRSLPTNIIGVQRVEGKSKLAEYYSMGDILLNLSYQETFGMTTAEAMACGTPGISYNVTACPELISPETGLVVEPGNMDQILSAIATIKQNGKHHYSDACRKRVLDNFDFKKVNHRFFEIYDEILKR
jgi:glycosyltransferase involved in cell wall biosynthesis